MTKTINCPHCGRPLSLVASGRHRGLQQSRQTTAFQHSQRLNHAQPAAVPDAAEWQRVTPVDRLHTGDVLTSIADGSVAFIVVAIAAGGIIWYVGGFIRIEGHRYEISYILAFGTGLVAFCYRYFGGMQIARSLLEVIETATNKDIDGDGHIGAPVEKPPPVNLEITQRSTTGTFQRMFDKPLPGNISEKKFTEWARAVLEMPDLTQTRWVGGESWQFVREDYASLLAMLEEGKIVKRKSKAKNAAYFLTSAGTRSLRHWVMAGFGE